MKSFKEFAQLLESKVLLKNPPHKDHHNFDWYDDEVQDLHHDKDIKKTGSFDKESIRTFTSGKSGKKNSSEDLNSYLRDLHEGLTKKNETKHKAVRKLVSNFTPENTNRVKLHHLYSGIPQHIGEEIMQSEKKSVHVTPGVQSFTSQLGVASEFAEGYPENDFENGIHIIHAKTMHPGVGMTVANESHHPHENEIITRPGNHAIYHGTETIDHPKFGKVYIHHMEYPNKQEDHENYGKN